MTRYLQSAVTNAVGPTMMDATDISLCTILLLDCPDGLSVGLDYCLWKIGPKFLGIRSIKPGPHFLFWCPPDESEMHVLGVFLHFAPGQIEVRRWSTIADAFESLDREDADRYIAGVERGDFIANLGPYPSEWIPKWTELSLFITKEIVERIEPTRKFLSSTTKEYDEEEGKKIPRFAESVEISESSSLSTSSTSKQLDDTTATSSTPIIVKPIQSSLVSCLKKNSTNRTPSERLEKNDCKTWEVICIDEKIVMCAASVYFQSDTLFFCDIPKTKIPPCSTSSDTTRLSLDKSSVLEELIHQQLGGDEKQLLGELQFSYICFLIGHNYMAFEQWKALVTLLCHCEDAVTTRPTLFSDFLRVLHSHISQAPDDFFHDELMAGNFLVQCLANICEVCIDPKLPQQLRQRVGYIKDLISQKFHMSIEELIALDENAPVIVDMDEPLVTFSDSSDIPMEANQPESLSSPMNG